MNTSKATEGIDQNRRQLSGTAAMGIAAAGAAGPIPAHSANAAEGDAIRPPFRINVGTACETGTPGPSSATST
jgi:hypothetical protein